MNKLKTWVYPGCSLESSSKHFLISMEKVFGILGIEYSIIENWNCCGASLFITEKSISKKLVGKILKDASLRGVDCITVSCPMCQTNLDTRQKKIRTEFSIDNPIPVPFITQLMGLAFGCKPGELGLDMNFVRMKLLKNNIDESI